MPAYDLECIECGGVTEVFMKYSDLVAGEFTNCPCGKPRVYKPSFYYSSAAQNFSPVVVHQDASGNYRFPAHSHAPVPEGYQRVELTTTAQIRSLERHMETIQVKEAGGWQDTKQKFLDGQLKVNREAVAAIAAGGEWQGVEDGQLVTRRGLSPRGKRFYDRMREISEAKQRSGAHRASPAFFVEAMSNHESKTRYSE